MRTYKLQCGVTLGIRYVPSVVVAYETSRRYPPPPKPTYQHELAAGVFEDRERATADWLQLSRAYDDYWPIAYKAVRLDMCVADLGTQIDETLLAERMTGVPAAMRFSDKVNYLLYVLLKSTYGRMSQGGYNELDKLVMFCNENDFTYQEAAVAGTAIKSDDPVEISGAR